MSFLSLIFGMVIGLSLGLTGGGGAIFAVPLLVFGLNIPAKEAVGISLAAVGATSLVGFLHRWRLGQVEIQTGLLFSIAGMLGAPIGTWLANFFPDRVLLFAFAGLMVLVAWRLWRVASSPIQPHPEICVTAPTSHGPTCHRDSSGKLHLTSRCVVLLFITGLATGVLSGLFGVGGGFVIVPALVLFSGMSIHRAVGTSLMVVALVSITGIASQLFAGREISPTITALFVVGGIAGLFAGQQLASRLSGPRLQKIFAIAILAVAAFLIFRSIVIMPTLT